MNTVRTKEFMVCSELVLALSRGDVSYCGVVLVASRFLVASPGFAWSAAVFIHLFVFSRM